MNLLLNFSTFLFLRLSHKNHSKVYDKDIHHEDKKVFNYKRKISNQFCLLSLVYILIRLNCLFGVFPSRRYSINVCTYMVNKKWHSIYTLTVKGVNDCTPILSFSTLCRKPKLSKMQEKLLIGNYPLDIPTKGLKIPFFA